MRQAVKEGRGKHDTSEIAAVMYEYLGLDTGEKKDDCTTNEFYEERFS